MSIRQSFSHNLSKHFSASAKNRGLLWLCLCFLSLHLSWCYPSLICFSFLLPTHWTFYFVLHPSGSSQFHMLWTLYLWWKYLCGFPEFFILIHLLCIVTLLMSLSIVGVYVLLPQVCWILLLDFLSSQLLLLLAILLSILIYLQICYFSFWGLLFVLFFSFNKIWCLYLAIFFLSVGFLVVLFVVNLHNTFDILSIFLHCFLFFSLHCLL